MAKLSETISKVPVGEPGNVPQPVAFSSAIYDATSIRLRGSPIKLEKILAALRKKR